MGSEGNFICLALFEELFINYIVMIHENSCIVQQI